MKRKVIIFTYYWPPAGGIAVQRFLKFSKYLPGYGWEPIIITVNNGSYPFYDEALLKEVSPSLRVYRTKTFEPFAIYNLLQGKKGKAVPQAVVDSKGNKSIFKKISEYIRANFFIPDARKGWKPYAIKQAEEILKTEKIDAIITTGPPHSTHLIGIELKKKYGLKWIADFRDPWTGIFYNQMLPRTKSAVQKDLQMECTVLNGADRVTVIGPGMKKAFPANADKITIVYNGFDEEDFKPVAEPAAQPEKFIIRYVGNLIGSQNVPALWNALVELKKEAGTKFLFEIVGNADSSVKENIQSLGLNDVVHFRGFVEHNLALKLMQQAALLVLIIPAVPDNALIITGKLFEYIGSGSEILGIGPVGGDADSVLSAGGRKPINAYTDGANMTKQLQEAWLYWKNTGAHHQYPATESKVFTRRKQAGELANILNEII